MEPAEPRPVPQADGWLDIEPSEVWATAMSLAERGEVSALRTLFSAHRLGPDDIRSDDDAVRAAVILGSALCQAPAPYAATVELDRVATVVNQQNPLLRGLYYAVAGEAAALRGDDESAVEHAAYAVTDLRGVNDGQALVWALTLCTQTFYRAQVFRLADSTARDALDIARRRGLPAPYARLLRIVN